MKKKPTKQKPSISNNPLRKMAQWSEPHLRFSPTAWAKLLYFRDIGNTEIGGFGITLAEDLLYIADFVTIKQQVSVVSVAFEDEAVADLFEDQVDQGRKPEQFARIWCHSHPGDCPYPSCTDEATFQRVFGKCDWAIMFIIARGGKTYCRLRFNVGPGGEMEIPVEIDYTRPFGPCDEKAWEDEYGKNIFSFEPDKQADIDIDRLVADNPSLPKDLADQLRDMDPQKREAVLEDLAWRYDYWNQDCEVLS